MDIRVGFIEEVAPFTDLLVGIVMVDVTAGFVKRTPQPTLTIFLMGHGFEMRRSDTSRIATQVIESETIENRSYLKLVGDSMRPTHLPFKVELPIPIAAIASCPFPATTQAMSEGSRKINLAPESYELGTPESHPASNLDCGATYSYVMQ